ncbi:MAG: CPBP family intramembrane metalloprotease [Clostridia bacterium]|nr:CPBP family intramembrane metalloprotease [Clostridia bacterium]
MDGKFYDVSNGFPFENNFHAQNMKRKKDIKSHAIRIGVCILIFLSAPFVLGAILGVTGLFDIYSENLSLQYCIEMLLMVVFLFLPFFAVYSISPKKDKDKIALSLEKPKSPLLFALAIPMGLMLCFAGDYISSVIATLFEQIGITLTSVPDFEVPTEGTGLFLFAFSTIVPPAIIEEFALRSVTMQPLRKFGDKFAIIMTALVFGLMHRNAVQGIFAFIAGIIFGYIAIAADSVWPAVIVHALNNSFSVILSVLNETNEEVANKVYALVVSIVMVAGVFSAMFFFLFAKRNKLRNPIPILPVKEKVKSFLLNIPMVISMVFMILYTLFGDL